MSMIESQFVKTPSKIGSKTPKIGSGNKNDKKAIMSKILSSNSKLKHGKRPKNKTTLDGN